MALLQRMELLKKEELKIQRVELGNEEYVFVRQMTARERDRFDQALAREVKDAQGNIMRFERSIDDFRAKLVAFTVCDEQGKNLLQPEDFETLSTNMSAVKLWRLATVAQKLNKVTDDEQDLDVKNYEAGPAGDSSSASV